MTARNELTGATSAGIIGRPMRPIDAVRALLSIVLTWAIVWMPIAPPLHAHRAGIEGRRAAVVHAHQDGVAPRTGDAGSHDRAVVATDHGDHLQAIFLDPAFERSAKHDLRAMALVPAAFELSDTHAGASRLPDISTRVHAPPLLRWVTRGPPSLSYTSLE